VQLPGEVCKQADLVGKASHNETEPEFVEVSRRHSTEKKSGRPEHEDKGVTGE